MTRFLLAASAAGLLGIIPAMAQTSQSSEHLSSEDHTFVRTAAQANEAEIQAGQLAESNAATPAVREFGRWMVTDHTMMNQMMKRLAQHENLQLPSSPDQQQKQQVAELKNQQGETFDQTYMNAQVQDHEKTIDAFRKEATDGQNPTLKQLADRALPVLDQHLAEAKILQQTTSGSRTASNTSSSSMATTQNR